MNHSKSKPSGARLAPEAAAARWAELVPRLCRAMMRHESNSISRGMLTLPQFWALEHLRAQGPSPMRALAAALAIKLPAASMLAGRLETLRLARRTRPAGDRRVVLLELTARGRRVVDEVFRQKQAGVVLMFRALSPGERADYIRLIEKMVGVLTPEESP